MKSRFRVIKKTMIENSFILALFIGMHSSRSIYTVRAISCFLFDFCCWVFKANLLAIFPPYDKMNLERKANSLFGRIA